MFKKLSILAALGLVAASCNVKEERVLCSAPVSVHVNDFLVTVDTFSDTKATSATEYSGVKGLTLAFYDGDTEVYKHSQVKGALEEGETFGEFNLSLSMGTYTMVVLGYGMGEDDNLVLTSPTMAAYTGEHARETFAATGPVEIASTEGVELSATLDRIIAKLQVLSTDGRAADATNVRMTLSAGGKAFNPTTGLATSNTGFSNTVNISVAAGTASSSITYLFLASDEQTLDVTVDVLDAEGQVLSSKVATGVPFQRNRTTKLTGTLYSAEAQAGSFQLETDWLPDQEVSF